MLENLTTIPIFISSTFLLYFYIKKIEKNIATSYIIILAFSFYYSEIFQFLGFSILGQLQIHDIFLIIIFLFLLVKGYIKNKIFIVLLFIWGVISAFRGFEQFGYSGFGESRQITIFLVIIYFGYYAIKTNRITKEKLEKVFFFIGISIVINHIISLFLFLGIFQSNAEWFRLGGGRINYLLFVSFFLALQSKNRNYKLWSLLFLLAIIVSQNRSIWLITSIYLFYYLTINKNIEKKVKYIFASFFLVLTLSPFFNTISESGIAQRFYISAKGIIDPETDSSSNWRLISWTREIENINNSPIVGSGFGNYQFWVENQEKKTFNTHNISITLISRTGFIGYALFIFLLIYSLVINNKNQFGTLVNGLVVSAFIFMNFNAEDTVGTVILLYWLFIGFKIGLADEK